MQLYVSGYIGSKFLRFLYSFFVQMPLTVWFRFLTAYWPSSATFINYTSVSEMELMQQWQLAQVGLATAPFPLNDSGGDMQPADPRASSIQPSHVTVVSVPDVPVSDLVTYFGSAWAGIKDPSGTILLETNVAYTACHSFACCWKKPRVYAAASKIPVTLAYEFQNIIMEELGYDVSNR
jgi:hypothetical protein